MSADDRRQVRQYKSKPLVASLKTWLKQQLARVSTKAKIAEEIRYGLNHWDGLTRFLEDGRIELDTNIVERGIRPIVLSRKNALFAGHDLGAENWACIASLVETCKLSGVDPQAYFAFDPRWTGCCTHATDPKPSVPARVVPNTPVIFFDESGKPKPELIATLEAIASNDCISQPVICTRA